jgi:hypothetical protein
LAGADARWPTIKLVCKIQEEIVALLPLRLKTRCGAPIIRQPMAILDEATLLPHQPSVFYF